MRDVEFDRFYGETAAPLHAYLARVGGSDALADDLVQTAYVRFLTVREPPRHPKARRVYLFRIARNLLRDELRRRGREVDAEGVPEPAAERPAMECESRIEVRRAFDTLSRRDRELLWLAYVAGLAHREIAAVADVAEGSVRVLLHRARVRFSELLEGRGLGPEDLA